MSRIGVQGQLLLENQEAAARDGGRKRIRRFKWWMMFVQKSVLGRIRLWVGM
jgi:hypothetical protein